MRDLYRPQQDQADGLRRLFAASRQRFIPVLSNPHVVNGGALLEGLCAAFAELGLHTLVVDDHCRTSVPGLYAIGDVTRGLNQIAVATGQAAIAATTIHNTLPWALRTTADL